MQASTKAGFSTRSSGGYPARNSSEATSRSARDVAASRHASRSRERFPAISPTVGSSWAIEIESESVMIPNNLGVTTAAVNQYWNFSAVAAASHVSSGSSLDHLANAH